MTTREEKEKQKMRSEALSKHFYNLSLATFTAMVLGNFTPLFRTGNASWNMTAYSVILGIAASFIFAYIGHSILKK